MPARKTLKAHDVERLENTSFASVFLAAMPVEAAGAESSESCPTSCCSTACGPPCTAACILSWTCDCPTPSCPTWAEVQKAIHT